MALVSDLVSAVAEVGGLPEETVNLVARYSREAGYLSQGARGRNAPRATVTDAANLLIAVNAGGCVVKEAPLAIRLYRNLICHLPHSSRSVTAAGIAYGPIEEDALQFLHRHGTATFGELLESVIERFIGGEMEDLMGFKTTPFLGVEFYKKGESAVDIVARINETRNSLVEAGTFAFNIQFYRPMPYAEIVIDRLNDRGDNRACLAKVSFIVSTDDMVAGKYKYLRCDRREVTTIGYQTLKAIGDVLKS